MRAIAVNTLHDASISVLEADQLKNFELERLTQERYLDLCGRDDAEAVLARAVEVLGRFVDMESRWDLCLLHGEDEHRPIVERLFDAALHRSTHDHHLAHAACALYASPFDEALIVSFDGGGYDGVFNVYEGRRGSDLRLTQRLSLNLGTSYRVFAHPIKEINKRAVADARTSLDLDVELAAAGKLMGLAAYGPARPEWVAAMSGLMRDFDTGGASREAGVLLRAAGLPSGRDELSGRHAYAFAASAQAAFEELFLEAVGPHLRATGLPVCLTGGAALNVLLNERVRRLVARETFVPPNPNDSGVTAGLLLDVLRPRRAVDLAYSGWPLLDLPAELPGVPAGPEEVGRVLAEGSLIGVARGNSEHGPRALGNRSILCDPGLPGLKARLNQRVKFREWFRPYAPVTRQESVSTYFEIEQASPYMSFAPRVREEWRDRLAAIVHEDGTARVQTVTRQSNPWLYEVLGHFELATGYGVLLNTSFNTKGRPILTRVSEALELLRTTDLDYVVIEDHLVAAGE